MDVKNHNTNRKKRVVRKRWNAAVLIALFVGILLTVFQYLGFVSKTVYEESVSHLTEIFHQSDNMLSELTNKNLTYLHIWGEYLQNTSDESEIREYIEKAQEDAGFLDFYFLSADGNYKMATGETGYLGLQENIEDEIRQGNDVITNATVPGKSQLLVFATPRPHGSYQGFEYDAIAIAYENSDIVNVLNISAFNGNAQSYVVHPDGRVVVDHSSEAWGEVYNFFGILREHSTLSEKEILKLSEEFKEGHTDAMLINLDGEDYYLVYEKSKPQDWIFLGLIQADIVNASMNALQRSTILLVSAVAVCIAGLFIGFILQKNRVNLKRKDTEILYRDELFQKLSMNVDDVFLMLDAKTYKVDYVSPNVEKLLGITAEQIRKDICVLGKLHPGDVEDPEKNYLEETEVSLSEVLHDLKTIISGQIHAKQLELYMDVMDVTNEDVYCDKTRLNQVLLNLLSNAIKFTPAGGTVSVRLREYPGTQRGCELYEIRVKDNGIGMSQKFVQKIFSPFERERTSTVSRTQGTGLGMAITKNIVDMMGGTIKVQTEQGKGTEFIIRLPLRIQPENHRIEKIAELEGLKALVVDDDFNTCDSVTKMLVKVGMRSEWTLSGKEAVLRARQSVEMGDAFHAYIIDWRLPDMNGIEVTRQIRSLGDDTPIIILTAYDWSDIEVEARAAGVTAFCAKPMFMSDIRETLMAAIGQKQAEAEDNVLPAADSDFRGRRILLVEDNELNSEIAVALLSEYGFQVDTAEDGAEAVERVRNSRPGDYDLVLMDVQMPVMNGYEATERIRSLDDPSLAGITILAMTANAFDEDRRKALACGMNGFLSKPIVIEELINTLQNILTD